MIELLEPVLPWTKPTQSLEMNEYQTMMGAIQDVEVIMVTLKEVTKKRRFKGLSLDRVQRFLKERHARLVQEYLERADELFSFWPASSSPAAMRFSEQQALAPLRNQ